MLGEFLLTTILNLLSRPPSIERGREGLLIGTAKDPRGMRYGIRLPTRSRTEHAFILGKTGTGKTHLLERLAEQHMAQNQGFALFDFHGDCSAALLRLATRYPAASERLTVIDPTDPNLSPGLNPLELASTESSEAFRRVSELTSILRARWNVEAFGPRSEELLRNVFYTLSVNGLTLVEAPLLLTSAPFRRRLTSHLPHNDIAAYWRDRFEPLSEAMKATFREPLLNKITAFLVEPATRHLLGQTRSTIDFAAAMQRGDWILINLSKGVLRESAHTLANLVFAKLQFEVFGRIMLPPDKRRLFTIMVDEVQNLAENDLISLITEGRKFGVGLITANQYWDQLPKSLRGALLAAGTQIAFRLSHADAAALAPELSAHARPTLIEQLTTLPRGHVVIRVQSEPPVEVAIDSGQKMPGDVDRTASVLRTLSVRRIAREREVIEREIAERHQDRQTPLDFKNEQHGSSDEGQTSW
jgi:hypothetical protein